LLGHLHVRTRSRAGARTEKLFDTLSFQRIIGGLLQVAFGKLMAQLLQNDVFEVTQVVGASAGAFGLIAAFAVLYPERPLMLLLFFIIPVNMRAKFLLLFEGAATVFGLALASRAAQGNGPRWRMQPTWVA